jgi:hypothetical protein
VRKGVALCFNLLGGIHVDSPGIGGHISLSVDFPCVIG